MTDWHDTLSFDEGNPKRKTPHQGEWRAQEIDWAFLCKSLPRGTLVRGIDQSGKRSAAANKARLRRGCLPGTPDTYILWNGITLWLERKKPGGGAFGDGQESFRDGVLANKGHWALVSSTEEVEIACVSAGIPLRATLGAIRERIADQNARLSAKRKRGRPGKPQTGDSMSLATYHRLHGQRLL